MDVVISSINRNSYLRNCFEFPGILKLLYVISLLLVRLLSLFFVSARFAGFFR